MREKKKSRNFVSCTENSQIKAVWQEKYTKTKFNTEIKAEV